jgi:uncharacterized protein (TIGR00369 family)
LKKLVIKKHNAGKGCFVCGVHNPFGLHTDFFELEDGTLAAKVTPSEHHQSYPGRLHGGISAALLDETIGRAITALESDTWAVTVEITTRYKKPVPYGVALTVTGRVVENNRRLFTGEGAILLPDGEVAVTATAKYMKLKLSDIADFEANGESWQCYPYESDPQVIELPES